MSKPKYDKKYRVQIEVEVKTQDPITERDIGEYFGCYPGRDIIYLCKPHTQIQSTMGIWGKFVIKLKEVK